MRLVKYYQNIQTRAWFSAILSWWLSRIHFTKFNLWQYINYHSWNLDYIISPYSFCYGTRLIFSYNSLMPQLYSQLFAISLTYPFLFDFLTYTIFKLSYNLKFNKYRYAILLTHLLWLSHLDEIAENRAFAWIYYSHKWIISGIRRITGSFLDEISGFAISTATAISCGAKDCRA